MNQVNNFTKGIFRENPILVLMLGACPTLAVTSSAINGMGMGLATTFVLFMSNVFISMVKNFVPDKVRIPAFVVVIASFVTVVDLLMQAYTPALSKQLGIFIPLIVVNCIVLGRAEAFAAKNNVFSSMIDGLGMGLGFTMALVILGGIREMLGAGSLFGYKFIAESADGILVFILAPGAFITLGFLIAILKKLNKTS
ncbi:MAG: electron transport complex subunit E [Bacteroidota bacterium]|nr:electron transport complex subunit E [Bacteroidota bacterium]MDO9612976.1 electron transport complex subunit E [Bacteroidota bacterium]